MRGLKLTRNFGQHPALCAGFRHATGDITVMMDADLEDLPEEVPRILAPLLRDDADIVYTVRDGCRKPWHRELTSRLYHRLFSWLSHSAVPKDVGTMRAFTRKVRSALIQHGERHILYGPLMMSLGFRTRFVSIAHPGHIGKSAENGQNGGGGPARF